jgi:hypothetical protein
VHEGGADGKRAEALERGHGFSGGESFEGWNPMSVLALKGARRSREKESVKGVRNPGGATNRVRQARG